MLSGLRQRTMFRSLETPYERLADEPEQRSPKEVETPFSKMKARILTHVN